MRFKPGDYIMVDAGAFDAPEMFSECWLCGLVMDVDSENHKCLVGTLAGQFPPTWITVKYIQGIL